MTLFRYSTAVFVISMGIFIIGLSLLFYSPNTDKKRNCKNAGNLIITGGVFGIAIACAVRFHEDFNKPI